MQQPRNELVVAVTEAVSDALGVPVEEVPPLAESIDPEKLDVVVTDESSRDVLLAFSHAGLRVFVHSTNTVYVRPVRDEPVGPLHEQ